MTITETTARCLTLAELAWRMRDHDDAAVRVLAGKVLDRIDDLIPPPTAGSDGEPNYT